MKLYPTATLAEFYAFNGAQIERNYVGPPQSRPNLVKGHQVWIRGYPTQAEISTRNIDAATGRYTTVIRGSSANLDDISSETIVQLEGSLLTDLTSEQSLTVSVMPMNDVDRLACQPHKIQSYTFPWANVLSIYVDFHESRTYS